MNKTISVIGGDSRQLYAAEYLINKGYNVKVFAVEHGKYPDGTREAKSLLSAAESEIIILPLPVSKSGNLLNTPLSSKEIKLKDITEAINESHKVFFGMGSLSFQKQLRAKTTNSRDYFEIESLIYKNALLTAEGIISILLEKLNVTVFGLKTAITGYGRIGKLTTERLIRLGADVSVFARNEIQRIQAETDGAMAYNMKELRDTAKKFDVIINTVPYQIINKEIIENSNKSCVFIEVASAPYGIDSDACMVAGRTLIKAFSLPGKTAPKSAGIIIGETIEKLIKEVN